MSNERTQYYHIGFALHESDEFKDFKMSEIIDAIMKMKKKRKGGYRYRTAERNYKILRARCLYKCTLEVIAIDYGLTRERIRQIVFHEKRRIMEYI